MSEIDLELSLNYKMQSFYINPPPISFDYLQELLFEKYDLTQASFYYLNRDGLEIGLNTEGDYSNMIEEAKSSLIKEIELVIKTSGDASKKRKKSLSKKSTITPILSELKDITSIEEKNTTEIVNEITCDFDYYGDTRNKKSVMDHGAWSNQCNNYKEKKRIYYIKESRDMQKDNQEYSDDDDDNEEEEDNNKKGRKRKLKCNQKHIENDDDQDNKSSCDTDESNNKNHNNNHHQKKTSKNIDKEEQIQKKQKENGKKGRCKFSNGSRY